MAGSAAARKLNTLKCLLCASAAAAAAAAVCGQAKAASGIEAKGAAGDEPSLVYAAVQQITVWGDRPSAGSVETSSATKTNTPLLDIPQAVDIISSEDIDDLAMRSLADVVRYAPGVTIGQGEGHRDQITIRGNNSTADFFIDGARDDIQYYRGLYNLERIEILKGPNALIFGRGGGGGVVNRVLKRPTEGVFAVGLVSADTFGGYEFQADTNASLSDRVSARLNAVYGEGRNHRDAFETERYAVNPTFRVALDARTTLDLAYEYAADDRVVDRGVPSESGRPVAGFRDAFFGARDVNDARFRGHFASVDLKRTLTDSLEANAKLTYGNFDKSYSNLFPATAVTTSLTGVRELGVEAYFDSFERRNFFAEANAVWTVATGPAQHTVLIGGGFGDQRTANARVNGFFDSGVPTTSSGRRTVVALADPLVAPPVTFRDGAGNRAVFVENETYAAYAQSQTRIGEHIELIGGARFDRFAIALDNSLSGQRFVRADDVFSPRAGAVIKPVKNASVYASWARSFLPQSGDQFVSLDASLAALEPEEFVNVEAGAKWNPTKSLALTLAAYRLNRTNTRAPGPTPGSVVLTGAQRSRGLEFSADGSLTAQWSVLLGYALQDAEITASTAAAPAGRKAPQVPRHALSAWSRFDATPRFGVGLGVQHQSESFASISNAVALPAFTRVDAAIYFKPTRRLEAQINVQNILNADYFPTAHNDNNITTGAPAAATFTLKARL